MSGCHRPQSVLFSAFEPSGDDLGTAVIAAFKKLRPDVRVFALGGPGMAATGAHMVERTGDNPVMGLPGITTIVEHAELNDRVEAWLANNPIDLHVPIDSPAANFPICKLTRARGAKIVHVVAPQMWAWGSWRIGKLRRLTDLVLCLLPFEPEWFRARGVRAEFIGHPMFDESLPAPQNLGTGDPKIAILPGSRTKEFERVFPLQLQMLRTHLSNRPGARAVLAAVHERGLAQCRDVAARHGGWPDQLSAIVGDVDSCLAWADVAIACSGTVTLRALRHRTPMVVVYRANETAYNLIGKRLLKTELRALANLAAGKRIVPEFVPLIGSAEPAIAAVEHLLKEPDERNRQIAELGNVAARFERFNAAKQAALKIAEHVD